MPAPKHLSLALLVTLALCCGANGQSTLYVDDDNCPSPGSGSAFEPYCSIQDAIVASADGDTVEVAPGTYFEAIDFIGKAITLHSRDGAATTIIDATNVPIAGETVSVVRCVNGETAETVLDGFTITGGTGDSTSFGYPLGGGMYNDGSSPTVANCTFRGNTAAAGGGIYNESSSSPMITSCTISENTVEFVGGGMANHNSSNSTVANCTFQGNVASCGGGMWNSNSHPKVTHCRFIGNNVSYGEGGGMCNSSFSNPRMTNCIFSANTVIFGWGGGMSNSSNSKPTVTNCMFIGNTATNGPGGGISNHRIDATISNCIFIGNKSTGSGGGMYNASSDSSPNSPTLTNCTFSGNEATRGAGIFNYTSSPTLTNCILSSNNPDEMFNFVDSFSNSIPIIVFSDISGSGGSNAWDLMFGIDGGGNIDADPLFIRNPDPGLDGMWDGVDDDYGDLRLMPGSPCIDAGDYDAYLIAGGGLVDLDGKDRVIDNTGVIDTGVGSVTYLDMGAYEQGPCHGDGIINLNDLENLAGCLVGPDGGVNPSCGCSDYNPNGHVDLRDVALFQLDYQP